MCFQSIRSKLYYTSNEISYILIYIWNKKKYFIYTIHYFYNIIFYYVLYFYIMIKKSNILNIHLLIYKMLYHNNIRQNIFRVFCTKTLTITQTTPKFLWFDNNQTTICQISNNDHLFNQLQSIQRAESNYRFHNDSKRSEKW